LPVPFRDQRAKLRLRPEAVSHQVRLGNHHLVSFPFVTPPVRYQGFQQSHIVHSGSTNRCMKRNSSRLFLIVVAQHLSRPCRDAAPHLGKNIRVPPAANQAVCLRFSNCSFVLPEFQAGGSLAGKDSMDASSTMSSASSCGGGSCGSIVAGGVSCGCFSHKQPRFYSCGLVFLNIVQSPKVEPPVYARKPRRLYPRIMCPLQKELS